MTKFAKQKTNLMIPSLNFFTSNQKIVINQQMGKIFSSTMLERQLIFLPHKELIQVNKKN